MNNKDSVGKFFIIKDVTFSDYMKKEDGAIKLYDTVLQAGEDCGMYEFENALICHVVYNHVE